MKNIIIFEGLDRTGKSSHVNLLSKKLKNKVKLYHCTGPDEYFDIEYEKNVYQAATFYNQLKEVHNYLADNKDSYIIFDRAFIGDYVWSKYYNRGNNLYDDKYVINKIFNSDVFKSLKNNILIVYLLANPNILTERIQNSNEDNKIYTEYGQRDIFSNINYLTDLYIDLQNITSIENISSITLYSNTPEDITKNVKNIIQNIKK